MKVALMKDAYGQEIWSHFNSKRSFEIVERDDGYVDVSKGVCTYFSEYDDWPEHEKKAVNFAKGRILDIGCCAGRHSIYLQNKGLDVTGIDISPLAIKVCRLRGLKKAKVMPISEIGKFKSDSFDTIIMLGNNFGLFGDLRKAKLLLNELCRITSFDAVIIAESNDPYKTDNPFHHEYQKANRKKGRMSGQLRIRIRFMKYVGNWFDYLIVSKEEMKQVLRDTKWKIRKFIDSNGSPYIAIIEKHGKSL